MTAKYKKERLKPCPCCSGKAEWVELTTKEVWFWQISCACCGLATIPDEKKFYCLQRWNRRDYKYKINTGWMLVILFSLIFIVIAFSLGLATGAGMIK
ncbi:MAG: hypothetical protein OXD32_05640 [Endozoicomonadaceae bacterium]|nr:hypothetical protein [Endozoicomonadaceae bacterium]MCY4328886.1 hypothetical protein [Endozoicomonadaceae bacterium]